MEHDSHFLLQIPLSLLGASLLSLGCYTFLVLAAQRWPAQRARQSLFLAWGAHFLALGAGLLATPARFGFAPALSMTAWLMMALYILEQRLYPRMRAASLLCTLSAAAVLLALLFPGTPLMRQHSSWMPLHLVLGVASYGLFAAAVVHAGLISRAEQRMRRASQSQAGVPLLTLERIMFRCVQGGFILLTATLLVGWFFSEAIYGHAWRWDHKAVFSALAWAVFAVLLLGRARFGWRGRDACHMVYAGGVLLLLAYAGSRFVLEVVLHRGV